MNEVFGFALSSVFVQKVLDDQGLSEVKQNLNTKNKYHLNGKIIVIIYICRSNR